MQKEPAQKLLFVINPVSGGKAKQDWEEFIRNYFRDQPHSMEFFLLTGNNDSASVAHYIQTIQPDKIVAVGGDGTVKLVAEIIKGTEMTMGILPAGSANGMARELGLPIDKEEALNVILNGERRPIDAIEVNGEEICIHLADMGLNAMLVKYFDDSPGRGMWGYGRSIFKMLWNKRIIKATIQTDEGVLRRNAYMIVLANARMYGTGVTINPKGAIDDGQFEIVIVRRLNFWAVLKVLMNHRNFPEEHVEIVSAKQLHLKAKHRGYFQVDGEYRGRLRDVRARILPHCLYLMLPGNQ
ncbi:diacylglycerol/lipid kinase family protein [Pseudocnuella soli]|uniref:diacylglycerol/lipid kinase family protein n=1 Tax=Pseudocnuella soli TaxID=2502779 RepID=UPI001053D610|nr:diacylglycerol kinase family protein [Pseudocnuella soli]